MVNDIFDSDIESEDYAQDVLEQFNKQFNEQDAIMNKRLRAQHAHQDEILRRTQLVRKAKNQDDLIERPSNGSIEKIPQLHKLFTDEIEPSNKQKIMVQTGPDFRLLTYNKDGVQVEHVYKQKKKKNKDASAAASDKDNSCVEEHMFDMFVFKVFALLMCRGTKVQKANILMDLINAPNNSAQNSATANNKNKQ